MYNIVHLYKGWPPPQKKRNQNYILEGGTLVVQASRLGECSRNPSVSVYQLVLFWDTVFSFSEYFFEDSFKAFAQFMMGDLGAHLPTPHWVFSSFLPKKSWLPLPLFTLSHLEWLFFVFLDEKRPQREMFCQCWRGETKKMAEAVKGKNIDGFRNFKQWKKSLNRCMH